MYTLHRQNLFFLCTIFVENILLNVILFPLQKGYNKFVGTSYSALNMETYQLLQSWFWRKNSPSGCESEVEKTCTLMVLSLCFTRYLHTVNCVTYRWNAERPKFKQTASNGYVYHATYDIMLTNDIQCVLLIRWISWFTLMVGRRFSVAPFARP